VRGLENVENMELYRASLIYLTYFLVDDLRQANWPGMRLGKMIIVLY